VIRVLIAARLRVVRAGLEALVRSSSVMELAGTADLALLSGAGVTADIVLMDAPESGIEPPTLPTVVLIEAADVETASAAMRAGARGVISREATPEEIEAAIQAVHAGLIVVAPEFAGSVVPETRPQPESLSEPLSERELEVLALVVEGLSNKLIAYRLSITEHTVKTHMTSILAKLGVASRTEAASQAIRRGLVML
jgi:DNA-binding NarL/FixJ family response regulator